MGNFVTLSSSAPLTRHTHTLITPIDLVRKRFHYGRSMLKSRHQPFDSLSIEHDSAEAKDRFFSIE